MKIELTRLHPAFDGERCYVHARGLILPSGTEGCMKYGSDNTIFVAKIGFSE